MQTSQCKADKVEWILQGSLATMRPDTAQGVEAIKRLAYPVAFSVLKNCSMAEDALAETLLAAHEFVVAKGSPPNPRAWVIRVACNKALDIRRRIKCQAELEAKLLTLHEHESLMRPEDERCEVLLDALQGLSGHHRDVIVLCDFEDLSYQEAADTLRITAAKVRSRLHHGRRRLGQILIEKYGWTPSDQPAGLTDADGPTP
jgi:RNA polymerase sigma factor (sigma-70 family)